MTRMTIGFVGLGLMGAPIVARLLANGFPVVVLSGPTGTAVPRLAAAGARVADGIADIAESCAVVFTCLPSSVEVAGLVHVPGGLLASARPGFIHIDLTSGEPAASLALAAAYAGRGVDFVDVGLSGAPDRAESGQLTLLVGASERVFATIQPLLSAFSVTCLRLGEVGSGHRAKLILAFYGMAIANATAEALTVARKFDIDLGTIHEVISGSGMNSTTFQMMALAAMGRPTPPRKLTIANAQKDVANFVAMASEAGLAMAVAPATLQSLTRASATGHADTFVSELTAVLSATNGLAATTAKRE